MRPGGSTNIGQFGERIAAKYLENKGYFIVSRNYRKVYGEIDLIARKSNKLYFIEVKSVSRETLISKDKDKYRPEENVHSMKMKRLANTIQAYLMSNDMSIESEWQFDVVTVEIDRIGKRAKCKHIENIIL